MTLSAQDRKGLVIGGTAAGLVIALLSAPLFLQRPTPDAQTLCEDGTIRDHAAVLIDETDPLTEGQVSKIKEEMRLLLDGDHALKSGTRLTVALIESKTGGASAPIFDMCLPRRGDDANGLYENPDQIEKKYSEDFRPRFDSILTGLASRNGAQTSPILESIQDFAYRQQSSADPITDLIVFSDLLHHTTDYSQYSRNASLDPEAFFSTPYGSRMVFPLKGARVKLFYLLRSDPGASAMQRDSRHILFWEGYLRRLGASVELVRKVP